ncbi:MAG: hypothetical protein OP8BY_1700 [Candidatus Saccharicenans subterraneus]|uniref:Uncharacterized protein n=1 Tax=Candidatus Saccharicenans subterraneus TaxID=2508984 RepID=A0A3E2BPE9_9BACT|nr:MAG: hypothetical protein OP8BY_1700 [Candidatus Saccharicenans subterraneum]
MVITRNIRIHFLMWLYPEQSHCTTPVFIFESGMGMIENHQECAHG